MPTVFKAVGGETSLVLLGGHVTRAARDRFAALARREGRTVAGYLRDVVEALTGEATPVKTPIGSARKLTLRPTDEARAALLEAARARRSTPTAWATALLEAALMGDGRPVWGEREAAELRALYTELKAAELAVSDPAALDAVRRAMKRVLGNLSRLQGEIEAG